MGSIWSEFIQRYEDRLAFVPMAKILEAFWRYTNNGVQGANECDKIMNNN